MFSQTCEAFWVCHPKICRFGILFWVKDTWETAGARRELWPSFLFLKAGGNTPVWKVPSLDQGEGKLPPEMRKQGQGTASATSKPYSTNPCLPSHFPTITAPCPNAFVLSVLYKRIVSSSKIYKNFLLWFTSLGLPSLVRAPMNMQKFNKNMYALLPFIWLMSV